ncbi:hypothetical protein GGR58DRAFT_239779 [Xylaria digitata]|nr:hypothetical protein GGR58DRAFT_239779 [Xylaria digitata]
MGNSSSAPSSLASPTHTSTYSSTTSSEPHRSFSVSPLEPSTFVSITKAFPQTSHGPSSIYTEEYCTWDWEEETSSCSLLTFTVDTPIPFSVPTPTGGYETSEASLSFPHYTCTDLICIDSVASNYGYSLCLATATPLPWPPIATSLPEVSTTDMSATITPTCDSGFDWDCPSPGSAFPSTTDEWPTITWDWPPETTSDCDTTDSSSTADCEFSINGRSSLRSSIRYTIPRITPSKSTTKHSYSYTPTSTRRTRTSATTECAFWDDDCPPDITWVHTASPKTPIQRRSSEVSE